MPFGIRLRRILPAVVVVVLSAVAAAASFAGVADWPQFRGVGAAGVAEGGAGAATPTAWDVPAGRNVKWKTLVPGLGFSCPVIWGDKLFITTAVNDGEEQKVRVGLY